MDTIIEELEMSLKVEQVVAKCANRDLTKPRRRRQRQKAMGSVSKTTTLHVHHVFLYISLLSLHDYNVKRPKFKFF